jgi:hypothetical protein
MGVIQNASADLLNAFDALSLSFGVELGGGSDCASDPNFLGSGEYAHD